MIAAQYNRRRRRIEEDEEEARRNEKGNKIFNIIKTLSIYKEMKEKNSNFVRCLLKVWCSELTLNYKASLEYQADQLEFEDTKINLK